MNDEDAMEDDVDLLKKVAKKTSTSTPSSSAAAESKETSAKAADSSEAPAAEASEAAETPEALGGEEGGAEEQNTEPEVDAALLQQLEEMGFPRVRAVKGLYYGSGSLEGAINWLSEHETDEDIDEPLRMTAAASKLSFEERKARLDEILAKKKKENAERQKELEKLQEIERIRVNKELNEARRKQEEQERKRMIEDTAKEKERAKKEREKIRAELEKDKAERAARAGKPAPAAAAAAAPKEVDPNIKRLAQVKNAIRKLYVSCRYPEDAARKAMELARKIIDNIAKNPTEEKYRSVRVSNPALQSTLFGKDGGIQLLVAVGFSEDSDKLTLNGEIDFNWLETCSKEITAAIAKGPFY